MKIAVPVDEQSLQAPVCLSFGRAPYYLLYDSDKGEAVFMANSAAASSGGAGIKAAQTLVDAQIGALLTPRCGENAAAVLVAAGVKLYKSQAGAAQANLDAWQAGELPRLADFHAGLHGHRGD